MSATGGNRHAADSFLVRFVSLKRSGEVYLFRKELKDSLNFRVVFGQELQPYFSRRSASAL